MKKTRNRPLLIKKTSEMAEIEPFLSKNNQISITNRAGRPTKYNAERIDQVYEYITQCENNNGFPTIEGFSWFIGTHDDTITNWTKKHPAFFSAIKRLKGFQSSLLQSGVVSGSMNPAGAIFLLKNNHGFKDKHEVDHTSEGERISEIKYITPGDPGAPKQ